MTLQIIKIPRWHFQHNLRNGWHASWKDSLRKWNVSESNERSFSKLFVKNAKRERKKMEESKMIPFVSEWMTKITVTRHIQACGFVSAEFPSFAFAWPLGRKPFFIFTRNKCHNKFLSHENWDCRKCKWLRNPWRCPTNLDWNNKVLAWTSRTPSRRQRICSDQSFASLWAP